MLAMSGALAGQPPEADQRVDERAPIDRGLSAELAEQPLRRAAGRSSPRHPTDRRGAGRNTTSAIASASTPPTPSITVGPNCSSRKTPAISSRLPPTIGATRIPTVAVLRRRRTEQVRRRGARPSRRRRDGGARALARSCGRWCRRTAWRRPGNRVIPPPMPLRPASTRPVQAAIGTPAARSKSFEADSESVRGVIAANVVVRAVSIPLSGRVRPGHDVVREDRPGNRFARARRHRHALAERDRATTLGHPALGHCVVILQRAEELDVEIDRREERLAREGPHQLRERARRRATRRAHRRERAPNLAADRFGTASACGSSRRARPRPASRAGWEHVVARSGELHPPGPHFGRQLLVLLCTAHACVTVEGRLGRTR